MLDDGTGAPMRILIDSPGSLKHMTGLPQAKSIGPCRKTQVRFIENGIWEVFRGEEPTSIFEQPLLLSRSKVHEIWLWTPLIAEPLWHRKWAGFVVRICLPWYLQHIWGQVPEPLVVEPMLQTKIDRAGHYQFKKFAVIKWQLKLHAMEINMLEMLGQMAPLIV